jgi:redox-sensitive bicupin YhaK (pirin superfamily)
MTSGSRGILHEEMPQVRPEGIGGLQPWLNLPARRPLRPLRDEHPGRDRGDAPRSGERPLHPRRPARRVGPIG